MSKLKRPFGLKTDNLGGTCSALQRGSDRGECGPQTLLKGALSSAPCCLSIAFDAQRFESQVTSSLIS